MTVKMKALKTFGFTGANEGPVKRGREFDARDHKRADELEAHGLAHRMETKIAPRLENKMELPPQNKAAEAGPFVSDGGQTGEDEPAPSLLQGQAPRRRRSKSSEDESTS